MYHNAICSCLTLGLLVATGFTRALAIPEKRHRDEPVWARKFTSQNDVPKPKHAITSLGKGNINNPTYAGPRTQQDDEFLLRWTRAMYLAQVQRMNADAGRWPGAHVNDGDDDDDDALDIEQVYRLMFGAPPEEEENDDVNTNANVLFPNDTNGDATIPKCYDSAPESLQSTKNALDFEDTPFGIPLTRREFEFWLLFAALWVCIVWLGRVLWVWRRDLKAARRLDKRTDGDEKREDPEGFFAVSR